MSEKNDETHPYQSSTERDKASPVWDMSQERAFLENLLTQRFNFFLVFFSIVIAGSVNAKTQIQLGGILGIGVVVSVLFALVLSRSQEKLDIVLNDLFTDESHPATICDRRATQGGSRRKLIGIWIPRICCGILIALLVLTVLNILQVPQTRL